MSEFKLKDGVWRQFRRKTGKQEHEQIQSPESESLALAFIREAEKYVFTDRLTGSVVSASLIGPPAADLVCQAWMDRPAANRGAVAITNAMASYICSRYDARRLDRRKKRA